MSDEQKYTSFSPACASADRYMHARRTEQANCAVGAGSAKRRLKSGERQCGCVIANAHNTLTVRLGYEMSGYIKRFCEKHKPNNQGVARPAKQDVATSD
jgi:hypothetical protein